jgi:hypothetical protein
MNLQHYHSSVSWKPWRYHCARATLLVILLSARISMADSTVSNPCLQTSIEFTEANNGSTIDIAVGTSLNIILNVLPEDSYKSACYWSSITNSDGSVLKEVRKVVLLRTGVTAAFFNAVHAGLVHLDSFRKNCSDGGVIQWHVTVRVTY